jgi:hypothetical protein
MSTATDTQLQGNDTDDFDGYAHYADKHGLVEAMVNGTAVVALCGHRFIPYRNPDGLPICEKCKAIHEHLPPGGGEE